MGKNKKNRKRRENLQMARGFLMGMFPTMMEQILVMRDALVLEVFDIAMNKYKHGTIQEMTTDDLRVLKRN